MARYCASMSDSSSVDSAPERGTIGGDQGAAEKTSTRIGIYWGEANRASTSPEGYSAGV